MKSFMAILFVAVSALVAIAATNNPTVVSALLAQDEVQEQTPAATAGAPRVKLVIPGKEPMLIDTAVAGDVTLILEADGQGVQVRSNKVDITLRRGTQPGSLSMSSPMGGTFEMQGQFAWMKDNENVLLATVGGSPTPLSGGQSQQTAQSGQATQPPANGATVPPDTASSAQKQPIEIVDGRQGGNQ